MATFKCPDCGKKVSTTALSCPKCGHVVTEADKVRKTSVWKKIAIGLFVLIVLGVVFGKDDKAAQKAAGEDPCAGITQERWDNASKLWQMTNAQCNPKNRQNAAQDTPTGATPAISQKKLEQYVAQFLPDIVKSAEKKHGRPFGDVSVTFPQFGTEGGTMYAAQVSFSKSLQEQMAKDVSFSVLSLLLKGFEAQGVTLGHMKKSKIMLVVGVVCRRSGKTVSYGIAVANPAEDENPAWVGQYVVQ